MKVFMYTLQQGDFSLLGDFAISNAKNFLDALLRDLTFVLFVDKMTHKYIIMYLHTNYESKGIYTYKIISHWGIRIMKMYSDLYIDILKH